MEIKSRLKALATSTAKSTCLQETSESEEITTASFATEATDSVITLVFSDASLPLSTVTSTTGISTIQTPEEPKQLVADM